MPTLTSPKARVQLDPARTALLLAGQYSLWEPLVEYDPTSRYYTRLAKQPGFDAWLLTWLPGQGTDWHDHGGSAGTFITVRGTLTERHAVITQDGPPTVQPGTRSVSPGDLRTFGRRHLHRVTNEDGVPAVSLHVYTPGLTEMRRYVDENGRLRQVSAEAAGVDW